MKNLLKCFLAVLLFTGRTACSQERQVDSIVGYLVSPTIQVPFAYRCGDVPTISHAIKKDLTQHETIILNSIRHLAPAPTNWIIDARYHMDIFYKTGEVTQMCVGTYIPEKVVSINDKLYIMQDKSIKYFLDSLYRVITRDSVGR